MSHNVKMSDYVDELLLLPRFIFCAIANGKLFFREQFAKVLLIIITICGKFYLSELTIDNEVTKYPAKKWDRFQQRKLFHF